MTMRSMSLHPSDETLSRLADQSEVERMGSRAGRHAARCDGCSATIRDLRGLGAAARDLPSAPLPDALLARIVSMRAVGSSPPLASPIAARPDVVVASDRPVVRRHWLTRKRGAVLAAALGIAVVALVAPSWRKETLVAAARGELTIFPRYPRSGATIGVRFMPAPGWQGGDTVFAEAAIDLRFTPGSGRRELSASVGTPLVRSNDGGYRGRLTLPPDALSGSIYVMTQSPATTVWGQIVTKTVLLTSAGNVDRPSLDAMENAVYNNRNFMVAGALASAFARWAPDHPMRWLVTDASNSRSFDWLKFFDTAERRYARLAARLDAQPNARAGELAGMAGLAYRLEEPEAGAYWTERLMREHPDNPWTLDLRVQQLHEMELRGATRDSIAPLIPSLDSLYERSGGQIVNRFTLSTLVRNNGDSATAHRWEVREARAGAFYGSDLRGRQLIFRDVELRDSAEAYAREIVARAAPGRSRFSLLERARAYWSLAAVALARGDYRRAIALTDSGRIGSCMWVGQDTRALALLALGDTASAERYLGAFGKNSIFVSPDSARALLGSHFNAVRWQQVVDSADADRRACREAVR